MEKNSRTRLVLIRATGAAFVAAMLSAAVAAQSGGGGSWSVWGQDLTNDRYQAAETTLSARNVGNLVPKWVYTTAGDVSATAAVVDGAVYFPDWGGFLYKLDAATGQEVWRVPISTYTGIAGSVSRTTPAVANGVLYFGSQEGGYMIAASAQNGAMLWRTQMDPHPAAQITQSAVVSGNRVYVGVASREEALATNPAYACCTFRGSMAALDATTGAIVWKTYLVPDNGGVPGGYSGGAVWGSSPSISGGTVYIATGNNYDVPQSVKDCQAAQDPASPTRCDSPDNHIDSIMALDASTGAIKWATKVMAYDAWTVACIGVPGPNCPTPAGPDYDFGQMPMLFQGKIKGKSTSLVGAGQKSGVFWALDPNTGSVVWATTGGPGSTLGGMEWGSATDGPSIYYQIGNNNHLTYTLKDGSTTNGGLWGALDSGSGRIKWQTADPDGAIDIGPISTANGVVYAGSMAGRMYAFDALNGKIIWSFKTAGSVNSGPAIVNGTLYWGSGYAHVAGTPDNKFYAFGLR